MKTTKLLVNGLHMNKFRQVFSTTLGLLLVLSTSFVTATEVNNDLLANEADGSQWASFGRTFSEQHYSPLDEVNSDTVDRLGLAWSMDLNDVWSMASVPVAVDGILYFAVGYSVVHAVDAVTGKLLWKYNPKLTGRKMRMAWGSRGLAYWKGKIYVGVQDGRLVALDAATGELVWETLTTEPGDDRYITGAPRAFNDKIIIGHGGADFIGVRGYVTAYDAETGEQAWRWYTVPGNPADGFENAAMEMAAKTWTGEWWKFGGGGTAWNAMTYDPEFNRVYIGTGNGSPWNHQLRSPEGGDNLFLCSVVALDADTGEYIWHYQTNPGESWDFNSVMDITLATLEIEGKPRKVILHAPKNGFFYVLDRETGELISAEPFEKVTWASHIDMETGRPVEYPGIRYEDGEAMIFPGSGGGHNWPPMAFSPRTKLTYIPTLRMAGIYIDPGNDPATWEQTEGDVSGLVMPFMDVPPAAGSSGLLAWDPVAQQEVWRTDTPGYRNGGVLATAGDLVFQAQNDGYLVAHDAHSGETLWRGFMGVGTNAAPITYSVDGRQYISVLAGWSGGHILLGSMAAQHGWVGRSHPRRVLTFALDGKAELPPTAPPSKVEPLVVADFVVDPDKALKGRKVYERCIICHGLTGVAGGFAPDLRASQIPLSDQAFAAIVRDGALEPVGMPRFAELSDEQLEQLQHFIRERANYKPGFTDTLAVMWDGLRLMVKMELMRMGWIDADVATLDAQAPANGKAPPLLPADAFSQPDQ